MTTTTHPASAIAEFAGYVDGQPAVTWLDRDNMPRVGTKLFTKAAANNAAEEGDDAMREAVSDFRKATYEFARGQDPDDHALMLSAQRRIFATYRASRHVANKAEVEPVTQVHLSDSNWMDVTVSEVPTWKRKGFETRTLYATPPATTGASTDPRHYTNAQAVEVWACVRKNNHSIPSEALDDMLSAMREALEAKPAGASTAFIPTVLTDERTAFDSWAVRCRPNFCDAPADRAQQWIGWKARSEVATQAGQVAVPEEALRVVRRLLDGSQPKDLAGAIMVIDSALNGGAAWTYDIEPPTGFADYLQANYSGEVIFHDPAWHARRLWNAAMRNAKPPFAAAPSPAKESK